MAFLPQCAQQLKPALARQHHIEQDQIGLLLQGCCQPSDAVVADDNAKAVVAQVIAQQLAQGFVVVNNMDTGHGVMVTVRSNNAWRFTLVYPKKTGPKSR